MNAEKGDIGIFFCDIDKDKSVFVGNRDVYKSLGISKFLLALEVYRQVEAGELSLEDKYVHHHCYPTLMPQEEFVDTVGILHMLHEGTELTIGDLLNMSLVISDNIAFNALLRITGVDNVNLTLKKLGLTESRIERYLFDKDETLMNLHSVREVGSLMQSLYKHRLVSASASRDLLRIMSYHQRKSIMSSFTSRNIKVYQQTGLDDTGLQCAAIVETPHPFILVMGSEFVGEKRAEALFRDIAQICGDEAAKDR